jgi:hypothetical protein
MSDEHKQTDDAIRSRLASIFPSEVVREKVIRIVTEKDVVKPHGFGQDSYSPYYKKHYGEQLQRLADEQLKTLQDIVYDYATFCKPKNPNGCSETSLYNRVNMSRRYLLERLDPDGKYQGWKEITNVRQLGGVGVVISIDPEIKAMMAGNTKDTPQPRMAEPIVNKPRWKQQLDDWVESDDTSPLVIRHLILTPEEQEVIRNELMGDRRIESIVTSSEIRAMKINVD